MKTEHRIRACRSVVRQYLAVGVAGLLAVSTLQDAQAQMCQGGGGMGMGGRMGGGAGGRGGGAGGGQGGGGGAGMMQMLQMAQQAQQVRAMQQQQSLLAAMRQQQARMQQPAGQQLGLQQASAAQRARAGGSFSEARRNRFRQSRATRTLRMQRLAQDAASNTAPSGRTTNGQRGSTTEARQINAATSRSLTSQLARLTGR